MNSNLDLITEPTPNTHQQLVEDLLQEQWGTTQIASRGKLTDAAKISRVMCLSEEGQLVGLATFQVDPKAKTCELVTLHSNPRGQGTGQLLVQAVEQTAKQSGCTKIWLITTNANPEAARFYVLNGYRLIAVHLDALEESRRLKPQIPKTDERGLPIQDEWEFAKLLS